MTKHEWRPFLCRIGLHRWRMIRGRRYSCERCWKQRNP